MSLLTPRRSVHPVDRMREEGTTFLQALDHLTDGCRFEQSLTISDPAITMPPSFWEAALVDVATARAIYIDHHCPPDGPSPAVEALRAVSLDQFADALESGDYADHLAF